MITMQDKMSNTLLKASLLFFLQGLCSGIFYQVPVDRRSDCGFPGITPQECFERDCIWDDNTPDAPWCYNVIGNGELPNVEPVKEGMITQLTDAFVQYAGDCLFQCTSIYPSERAPCSASAINMQSCLREGCCWDETGSQLQCYHPDVSITMDQCPTDPECQAADGQIELCSAEQSVSEAECRAEGCCYTMLNNQPLCYRRQPSALVVGNTTSNVDRPFQAMLREEGKSINDFSLRDLLQKSPEELFPTEPPTTTTEKTTTTTLVSTTERIITLPTKAPKKQKQVCTTRWFRKTCKWVDVDEAPKQCMPQNCGKPVYFPGSEKAKADARKANSNLSKAMAKKKIVGGTRAYPFSHPWTAMLLKKEGKRGFLCGASVICEHWLVTAAHCMNRQTSKTDVPDLDTVFYTIQVGRHNGLDEEHGEQVQTFSGRADIDYIELHPNFTSGVSRGIITNDIAVIRLKKPIKFNDYVQPICLPSVRAKVNKVLWAAGWGITKGRGPTNEKLKQLGVKIFNESACVEKVPKFNNPKGVLCAGGEVDQDTCTGDSGGPLAGPVWKTTQKGTWMRPAKRSYQWQLYGLTSIGSPNCNTLSFDRQPAVYTDVAYFSDWVKKQTQNCCR